MKRRDVLLAAGALFILWQITAMIVNLPILPPPLEVLRVFFRELGRDMLIHFAVSLWRITAGMTLSVLVAAPAGLAIGGSKRLNRFFSPFIYLLYPIPKVVLVPVVILFLGIGDVAKIAILFLILFFQILVLVRDQASGLAPQLIQSLRSLGAGRRALFRFVYLPASLPAILTTASIHRDGGGSAVHHGIIRHEIRTWVLYLLQGEHPTGLPCHVCGCDRHEPTWAWHVFQRGLAGTEMVQVEVC
jgi:NitT/TauT family transport system permease protein